MTMSLQRNFKDLTDMASGTSSNASAVLSSALPLAMPGPLANAAVRGGFVPATGFPTTAAPPPPPPPYCFYSLQDPRLYPIPSTVAAAAATAAVLQQAGNQNRASNNNLTDISQQQASLNSLAQLYSLSMANLGSTPQQAFPAFFNPLQPAVRNSFFPIYMPPVLPTSLESPPSDLSPAISTLQSTTLSNSPLQPSSVSSSPLKATAENGILQQPTAVNTSPMKSTAENGIIIKPTAVNTSLLKATSAENCVLQLNAVNTSPLKSRATAENGVLQQLNTSPFKFTAEDSFLQATRSQQATASKEKQEELKRKLATNIAEAPTQLQEEEDEKSSTIKSKQLNHEKSAFVAPSLQYLLTQSGKDHSKQKEVASGNSLKKLLKEDTNTTVDTLQVTCTELQNEPQLLKFLQLCQCSKESRSLQVRVLSTGENRGLKWIEVTRKASYIEPNFGPLDIVRILVSSHNLCKVQMLFPYFKTLSTQLVPYDQQDVDALLSELSPQHVLCPGLPDYEDKFKVIGYHPTHTRVLENSTFKRYDHENCALWHVPSNLFSPSGHHLHNMCKNCRYLESSLVRLANRACEVDPQRKESWTDPSSTRPLSYLSASEKEERYRKLKQERAQLLAKVKQYEEKLGICKSIHSEDGVNYT